MSTVDPQERPVRVRYAPGLALSVPIIADRAIIDQLYAYAGTNGGAEIRAYALDLGIAEPSSHHEWTMGWSSPGTDRPTRLVWYDPAKLAGIDAMIRTVIADHPDIAEVTVIQGAGWDDYGVLVTGSGSREDDIDVSGDDDAAPQTGATAAAGGSSANEQSETDERPGTGEEPAPPSRGHVAEDTVPETPIRAGARE